MKAKMYVWHVCNVWPVCLWFELYVGKKLTGKSLEVYKKQKIMQVDSIKKKGKCFLIA